MGFVLDDDWDNDPRVSRAGTAAFGLYSRCGMWVARHLTDGFVPTEIATSYGTREWAAKLVAVGLWQIREEGFWMPDYLVRNPAAELVRKRRAQYAARQQRWRDRRRDSNASSNASGNAAPSPPLKGKGVGRVRAVPPWCQRCHPDTRMYVGEDDAYYPCPTCHPGAKEATG